MSTEVKATSRELIAVWSHCRNPGPRNPFEWPEFRHGRQAVENADVLHDHLIDLLVQLKDDPDLVASFIQETNLPLLI